MLLDRTVSQLQIKELLCHRFYVRFELYWFLKSQIHFPIVILGLSFFFDVLMHFYAKLSVCLFLSVPPVLVLFQVVLCVVWRSAFCSHNRSALAAQIQDSTKSVSKSVSPPLNQLAGQSEKSARQFSVSPASVLTR